MHGVGAIEFQLYLRTLSTIVWETASRITRRNCSKVVREEVSIYVILKNVTYSQTHILALKVTASHEAQISWVMIIVLFWVWKCRKGVHKIVSKIATIWRPALLVSPEHREPDSWSLSWIPVTVCWNNCSGQWGQSLRNRVESDIL